MYMYVFVCVRDLVCVCVYMIVNTNVGQRALLTGIS